MKRIKYSGFTIVELLVVIVIIAIIAAITVIAYIGIQSRATNTSTISVARQVQKLLNANITQTGQDITNIESDFCLTTNNICLGGDGVTYATTDNSAVVTKVSATGRLPKSAPATEGLFFRYNLTRTLNGQLLPNAFIYWLKGSNVNCGLPVISNAGQVNNETFINSTTGNSGGNGQITACVVPLLSASSV